MSSQAFPSSSIDEIVTSPNFIPSSPAGSQPLNAAINSVWFNETINTLMIMTHHGWMPMTVNSDPDLIDALLTRAAEKSYHHLAVSSNRNIASKVLAITSSSINNEANTQEII